LRRPTLTTPIKMRTSHVPTDWLRPVFLCVDRTCPLVGKTWRAGGHSEAARVESPGCNLSLSYASHDNDQWRTQVISTMDSSCIQNASSEGRNEKSGRQKQETEKRKKWEKRQVEARNGNVVKVGHAAVT